MGTIDSSSGKTRDHTNCGAISVASNKVTLSLVASTKKREGGRHRFSQLHMNR